MITLIFPHKKTTKNKSSIQHVTALLLKMAQLQFLFPFKSTIDLTLSSVLSMKRYITSNDKINKQITGFVIMCYFLHLLSINQSFCQPHFLWYKFCLPMKIQMLLHLGRSLKKQRYPVSCLKGIINKSLFMKIKVLCCKDLK